MENTSRWHSFMKWRFINIVKIDRVYKYSNNKYSDSVEHKYINTVWFSVESLVVDSRFLQLSLHIRTLVICEHVHMSSWECQREEYEYLSRIVELRLIRLWRRARGTLSRLSAALLRFHERTSAVRATFKKMLARGIFRP